MKPSIFACLALVFAFFSAETPAAQPKSPNHIKPVRHPIVNKVTTVTRTVTRSFVSSSPFRSGVTYPYYSSYPVRTRVWHYPLYFSYSSPSYSRGYDSPPSSGSYSHSAPPAPAEPPYTATEEQILIDDCLETAVITDFDQRVAKLRNDPQAYINERAVKQYARMRGQAIADETGKRVSSSYAIAGENVVLFFKIFQ